MVPCFKLLFNMRSGKLPTYSSPKPTICLKWEVSVNIGLGKGPVGSFPETYNYSTQSYYLHLVFSLQILSGVIPLDVITALNVIY